jgi:hypothetical protein
MMIVESPRTPPPSSDSILRMIGASFAPVTLWALALGLGDRPRCVVGALSPGPESVDLAPSR